MTAPVQDAGFLAPVVARLDKIESAMAELNQLVARLSDDTSQLRDWRDEIVDDVKELRDAIEGRD